NREKQAYAILKDRTFGHTNAYDPELLEKIGMDIEFTSIWSAIGWDDFSPIGKLAVTSVLGEISGQMVSGKFTPRCNDIQNPTLPLMHKWLAVTLFLREDILSPNPGLRLYNCRLLTMPVLPQEEARKSNVSSGRMTRSMPRSAAIQQPPPSHPQPQPPVYLAQAGWPTAGCVPGHRASSSAWQNVDSDEWDKSIHRNWSTSSSSG
uniref:Uncharacterized protein n=1 Tax=Setaria italica TaxID=4555 RepID=K4A2E9_SETIT